MIDLLKIFQKDPDDPVTELSPSQQATDGLEAEYHALIEEQLRRGGVSPSIVDIEVRPMGRGKDGRPVYTGMVRLKAWERRPALRLMLGLPLLEDRLKRAIHASWMHDVASFGGLWVHASGQLQEREALKELRALVLDIESREPPQPQAESVWALSKEMDP